MSDGPCELSPAERVSILSRRLVNLRAGAGQYTPQQRLEEIAETQDAIEGAFLDHGATGAGMSFDGLPRNHYSAILADPPWHFKTYNEKGRARSPDWRPFKGSPSIHYDTMSAAAIRALPVSDLAAEDCALFLWICWPLLEEAIELIGAWGFAYKTCAFAWTKAHASQVEMFRDDADGQMGMGYWTRSNSEVCLLAVRDKPRRLAKNVRQAIIEPRREHSRKPDCVYGRIERLVAGPYIELFARNKRPGWSSWGNQVGKFAEVA